MQAEADSNKKTEKVIPVSDYKDKYKHLIGDESAKGGAKQTLANRSYGFGKNSSFGVNPMLLTWYLDLLSFITTTEIHKI